jgi:hypothetical protein
MPLVERPNNFPKVENTQNKRPMKFLFLSVRAAAKNGGIVGARNGMCVELETADSLTQMAWHVWLRTSREPHT